MANSLLRSALLLCGVFYGSATLNAEQINFENLSGPALFSGTQQTLFIPTSIGTVTLTGGEILTGETDLPADQTSVYGSVLFNNLVVGYSNPITLTFPKPINNLFLDLFNGNSDNVLYTLSDNAGNTEMFDLPNNFSGGSSLAGFAATGSVVTIYATPLNTDVPWDFSIDNVTFNEQLPAALAPEPAPAALLAFGLIAAGIIYRRKY